MESKSSEASKYCLEAEKKLKPGFFSGLFSSKSSRLEEALTLYEKAGNLYKILKNWNEAGECFYKCGELEIQLGADAAGHFQDAAHCFSFVDSESKFKLKLGSSKSMEKAFDVYVNQGRFQMAGKIQKQMAENFEENFKYPEAIDCYQKAADYFSMENSNTRSYEQGCLLKQADLMCITDYKNTFEIATKVFIF